MGFEISELLSGQTLPDDWLVIKVGDVADVNLRSISKKHAPHEIKYLDISSVSTRFYDEPKLMLFEDAPSRAQRILSSGDTIISTVRPNLRSFTYIKNTEPNLIGSTGFACVSPKNIEDALYLHYVLTCDAVLEYFIRMADGAAYPAFDYKLIPKSEIPWPPNAERHEIGELLGSLDDRIALLRETNSTLEAIAQALFKSWFVDFDPVRAKQEGRTPEGVDEATAALFPDGFEESELRLLPKGWGIRKAEHLLTRLSTKVRYTKEQAQSSGAIPIYEQGAKILLGYHDGNAQFQATPNEPIFIFGDHTCVTHLSCEPFDISMNVIALKGSDRPTLWTYYAIKDKQTFQEYRRHWMELAVKEVIVPPYEICLEFSQIACPIHLKIESNTRQVNLLENLRDTLLPRLISGQLRLPEAEAMLAQA